MAELSMFLIVDLIAPQEDNIVIRVIISKVLYVFIL
jgi:hypothetical protein